MEETEAKTDDKVEESAALKWAKEQVEEYSNVDTDSGKKKKYVIVGAGWGGWGAAKALCESGVDADITIIDALPDPTGNKPYLSETGKPVEAGTRGFWMDYPNINKLCDELGLDQDKVFTDYTNSSFYSPDGLEATAPVFSKSQLPDLRHPFLSALSNQFIPYCSHSVK
jgi:protoporphyrinogen oxidase